MSPAFLGVVLWETMGTWVALPAFTLGLIMLPTAYVSWFLLQNSEGLLGADRPRCPLPRFPQQTHPPYGRNRRLGISGERAAAAQ